ncbi:MAG: SH3 domain-containing protein [Anaerolineae bacterium]|nr:MAG: SH3 domain-containing protein [Anaerolineae bacterium]
MPPTPIPEPAAKAVVNTATMNVRSGPGTNYPITGRATRGTTFDITGRNAAGDWWQVCCVNSQNGWVVGRLVNISGNTSGVEVVSDVAPPPAPTAAPTRSRADATAGHQAGATPTSPPAATIFSQAGAELRDADDTNFNVVTFWGRLGRTAEVPITGGYRLRVSAPTGTIDAPFGSFWENAYSGYGSAEFRYNAKVELPRTAGSYRAVVIDGSGKEVSDPISGNLNDRTHDVILAGCAVRRWHGGTVVWATGHGRSGVTGTAMAVDHTLPTAVADPRGLERLHRLVREPLTRRWILAGLILAGLFLRLLQLDFQPLWWDEGYSVWFATHDLTTMALLTAQDIHPPLYYALLHGWIGLLGASPVALRLFSVVVSLPAIPLAYLVVRSCRARQR